MPRCGLEVLSPKNSAFRRGVSVPLKVKNELAYDLSLRGGATGEGFFSANFKCFFGKVSRKRLFLFLLFVVFFFSHRMWRMQRDAARSIMRIKGFSGTPVIRFISYHFLMVWWDPRNSSFHEFFYSNLGSLRSLCGFCRFETCHPMPSRNLFEAFSRATFRMHILQCEGPRFQDNF